ncbi:phytanoyl-CoA dioxygenase family protein [Flavobacterium sp. 20NA77.7]|uniref:Phytanoyl-CoA dioxygenase family protein n=1 Tax=Flavobacterium nakdongensis TaxID=3073563 RepID=A0ABY9R8H4_9FLAO|nr:phytanoyl-CoA dioxygenase family protein [Flavobacterium sp. 20NA77.7]WMW77059.1 phytanoyl-CoA dioxygenase family protein [Flavobacterium sp. 20NA77.7]
MSSIPKQIAEQLNENYTLNQEQIDFYASNKFIKLKNVLDKETVAYFNTILTEQVALLNTEKKAIEERSTYGKAFLQLFNLWAVNPIIKELVFSKRIAKIASELMQVNGVRLYHDQALFKEAGGGITPWHADQYYWPLHSDKTITAWIPLQATPLEMGPLEFSAGSHTIVEGRELEIGDESEQFIDKKLKVTDFKHVIEPFDIGEISFHSGWVFHRAGANITNDMRKVMTIIYMEKDMKLKQPENKNQENDWHTWCPGAKVGEIINSPINPVLYAE